LGQDAADAAGSFAVLVSKGHARIARESFQARCLKNVPLLDPAPDGPFFQPVAMEAAGLHSIRIARSSSGRRADPAIFEPPPRTRSPPPARYDRARPYIPRNSRTSSVVTRKSSGPARPSKP